MVVRSPFLLGMCAETLQLRLQALQAELGSCDVHRMAEYYPSLLQVLPGKLPSALTGCRHTVHLLCPE